MFIMRILGLLCWKFQIGLSLGKIQYLDSMIYSLYRTCQNDSQSYTLYTWKHKSFQNGGFLEKQENVSRIPQLDKQEWKKYNPRRGAWKILGNNTSNFWERGRVVLLSKKICSLVKYNMLGQGTLMSPLKILGSILYCWTRLFILSFLSFFVFLLK